MRNKYNEYLRKQVELAFLNEIELQGLREEAVERGFTPLRKSIIIIEAYTSNGCTKTS